MARIDYYGIEQALKTQLQNDSDLSGKRVEIERFPTFDPMDGDAIYIYLENRQAPENIQRIRAGTSTDMDLFLSVWIFAFHADDNEKSAEFRDDLLGQVELAIMDDRTLGGTVDTCWINGGEFHHMEESGFWNGAEIQLQARAQAVT